MYLNAERIAVANKAVQDTFEQTCIAWQAIPHWDTGDRARLKFAATMRTRRERWSGQPLGGVRWS